MVININVITISKYKINDRIVINCDDLEYCEFLAKSDGSIKFFPIGNGEYSNETLENESMTIEELRDYFYD